MALNTVLLFKFHSLLSILSLGLCTFFGYLSFQVFSRSFYAMSEECGKFINLTHLDKILESSRGNRLPSRKDAEEKI